jgi:hypothetical protein
MQTARTRSTLRSHRGRSVARVRQVLGRTALAFTMQRPPCPGRYEKRTVTWWFETKALLSRSQRGSKLVRRVGTLPRVQKRTCTEVPSLPPARTVNDVSDSVLCNATTRPLTSIVWSAGTTCAIAPSPKVSAHSAVATIFFTPMSALPLTAPTIPDFSRSS